VILNHALRRAGIGANRLFIPDDVCVVCRAPHGAKAHLCDEHADWELVVLDVGSPEHRRRMKRRVLQEAVV
jgi:hypothetical protein